MTEPNDAPISTECQSHPILDKIYASAKALGLTCLDTQWQGSLANYHFICQHGHQFTRKVRALITHASATCTRCRDLQRFSKMQEWAAKNGGRCLEADYLGQVKHRFVCAQGHEWQTFPHSLLHLQTWCRVCGNETMRAGKIAANGFECIQRTAEAKGGRCISTAYESLSSRYVFECAKGHQWETKGAVVVRGGWCQRCAWSETAEKKLLPDGLLRLQQAAKQHGGECLDQSYTTTKTTYRFRCAQGHEWESKGNPILRGRWCRKCQNVKRGGGIARMNDMAKQRGGICLSNTYVDRNTQLLWECRLGHQWHTAPSNIKNGSWCPQCAILRRCTSPKSNAALKYLPTKKIIT